MGFVRRESWSGLPFAPPGELRTQRSTLRLLHGQADSLPPSHLGNPVKMKDLLLSERGLNKLGLRHMHPSFYVCVLPKASHIDFLSMGQKAAEDETVVQHHQSNGQELEQTPGEAKDREAWRAAVHGVRVGHHSGTEQQQWL